MYFTIFRYIILIGLQPGQCSIVSFIPCNSYPYHMCSMRFMLRAWFTILHDPSSLCLEVIELVWRYTFVCTSCEQWYCATLGPQDHSAEKKRKKKKTKHTHNTIKRLYLSQYKFNNLFIIRPGITVTFHMNHEKWSIQLFILSLLTLEKGRSANNFAH